MAVSSPLNSRPTVAAMLVLTAVTGLIDTFSYLQLGHVFVAYMTGNVIFLGAGLRPGAHPAVAASATALAGFVLGSLTGGRIAAHLSRRPRRWLVVALAAEAVILALVALLAGGGQATPGGRGAYVSIALLALAAGLQNSTVRHLGVRDLNTSVLTLTLTGLTADSALGGGSGAKAHRRLGSVAAMLGGAAVGATLLQESATSVVVLAAVLVALVSGAFATGRSAASGASGPEAATWADVSTSTTPRTATYAGPHGPRPAHHPGHDH
ncbi:YoaK family protein [Streptomyces sp. NPDC056835]|uniref:YoaK family protein n=1 Tax=Streptomyces sp. NPDC056835 TaxID=3345956 RepID=UPI00367DB24C